MPTVYVQIRFPFTNSFSRIIFINSLSPIFFYKFNITNSFSRINLRIRKSSKKFVLIRKTSFWFVFAKSVLCCERPVLYHNLRKYYNQKKYYTERKKYCNLRKYYNYGKYYTERKYYEGNKCYNLRKYYN